MAKPAQPRLRRLLAVLRDLARHPDEALSIDDLLAAFGERSLAAVLLLFGLLTVVSIFPGVTFVTGTPLVLAAWQLVRGRDRLLLPARIRQLRIRPADIARLNNLVLRHLRRVERLLAPRLTVLFGRLGTRVVGAVCLFLSVIVFLPIPLGNLLPGIAISILAVAYLARDGLAVAVGVIVGIASIVVLIVVYGALVVAIFAVTG